MTLPAFSVSFSGGIMRQEFLFNQFLTGTCILLNGLGNVKVAYVYVAGSICLKRRLTVGDMQAGTISAGNRFDQFTYRLTNL